MNFVILVIRLFDFKYLVLIEFNSLFYNKFHDSDF